MQRHSRRFLPTALAVLVFALAGAVAESDPACAQVSGAQPSGVQPVWEGLITPYLWIPWTSVGVTPANTRIPSASGTIDPSQLFDHLSWVPFMGEVEFRNGPVGVLLDYLHAPLRVGFGTRDILFGGGTAGFNIDTGTAMFLYRPIAQPNQYVDVGMGVRVWGLDGDISLNEARLPAVSVTSGADWADPLLAARYHRELGNGFGVTAYGDVGGFGLGAHIDWRVIGTVDYALKTWIDLHAGFQSLNFNNTLERGGLNVNMYGPLIAATFRF